MLRRAAAERRARRAIAVDDEAIDFLAARSEGDARTALNALELAAATAAELGERARDACARVEDALQRRAVLYDKKGDRHYDYISAWIKATRGSDPDASLYYLAVMLEGGEDPRFIVRRMVILASEDIGNADPGALSVATAAAQAVEHVGLPEARYALAQAAIYLSLAPKSNAAGRALSAAERHVREHGAAPVPGWLRSRTAARAGCRTAQRLRQPARAPGTPLLAAAAAGGRRRRALLRARRGGGASWRRAWSGFAGRAARRRDNRLAMSTSAERDLHRSERASHRARPGDGRGARQRHGHAARARSTRWSRRSPRCSRCGRCCGSRTARGTCGRMAQAVIDDFDELQEGLAREQGRPRAEIAALELLAAIDALMWIADDGADVLGGRRVGDQPLDVDRQARAHRLRALWRGRRDRRRQRAVRAAARADRGGAAGGQRRRLQARRAGLPGGRADRAGAGARRPAGGTRARRARRRRRRRGAGARAGRARSCSRARPAVGRVVARACVSREKEVTVELGGKDAMLVLADAHLPRAVAGALWAGCAGAGQARGSIERVYVAREVYERFLAGLVSGARALTVGDPADPRVQVGPLASARRAEHVERARRGGGRPGRAAALRRARSARPAATPAPSTRPR